MGIVTTEDLKTLTHPYYIVNLILSLSFITCKFIPPICNVVFAGDSSFEMRETEILFFLLMIVMIRARKTGSLTIVAYLTNAFVYCKVANTVLWFFTYKPYGLLYLFLFLSKSCNKIDHILNMQMCRYYALCNNLNVIQLQCKVCSFHSRPILDHKKSCISEMQKLLERKFLVRRRGHG